jgi:hypothetical protein
LCLLHFENYRAFCVHTDIDVFASPAVGGN